MKNLIKLLSILTISTPIPLTAVGCDNKSATQKVELKTLNEKLNDEITKITANIPAKTDKNNRELDKLINKGIKNINLNPNLVKPKIKYFSDEQGKNDITNRAQVVGDLYVTISANVNDRNYHGTTNPIKINLKETSTKIDLNTITEISGLDITASPGKTYQQLIDNINDFSEFKAMPLAIGYKLQFYDENDQDITTNKQELENISKIVVKITSSDDDQNYQGSTKIDLTKQLIITDQDMQDYFASVTVPIAGTMPKNPSTPATDNKEEAITNVVTSLKEIQKKYESLTKLILSGIYKAKIDLSKLRNESEIYNKDNEQPVANDWFKEKAKAKEAKIIIFYGDTEKGYFMPIKIDIT